MKNYKVFRYRIYPTAEQIRRVRAWQGALRFLWNLALEQRLLGLSRCADDRIYPSAFDQQIEMTELRADLAWLADVPRGLCEYILGELDIAWQRCFSRLAMAPRFKRKGRSSVGLCEPHPKTWHLKKSIIWFPKIGNMRAVVHREPVGKPKTCTLREEAGQWFASCLYEIDGVEPTKRTAPVVALDRGVANVIADSDGNIVENPKHAEAMAKRLARAQRNVSRKKKGSKNREKAKQRVAVLHRKVRRQREWFLHQISARLSKSHAIVVVERLNIENMTKSATGTVEDPGANVRQKAGLNRSILGAGWGELVRQLRYKLAWSGGALVDVPAAYSSQTCHGCGHISAENRPNQSAFECGACGLVEHADVNAAKVLLQRFEAPGNPWCQLGEASPSGGLRTKKRLRTPRRVAEGVR